MVEVAGVSADVVGGRSREGDLHLVGVEVAIAPSDLYGGKKTSLEMKVRFCSGIKTR